MYWSCRKDIEVDVFCRKKYSDQTVLVVYGGPNEVHELAVEGYSASQCQLISGSGVKIEKRDGYVVANWAVTPERKVVKFGTLTVYMLSEYTGLIARDFHELWVS